MIDIPVTIYFYIKEHPLKTSNKRTHIPLLINQGFGREIANRGKFIGSYLVNFCYKEFEKFAQLANRKSYLLFILSQSKAEHVKIKFS